LPVRACAGAIGLALLAGCGSGRNVAVGPSTNYYLDHAAGNYQPPGPPGDPWGPYIHLAASRFDVPEIWIRQVMRVESGGQEYMGGQLTVSPAGAMGLMQLEPETYQEMADRYGLGPDPFNPYDNIMAGTAYIHEMYTIYGSPGFLAAYNAGPGRVDRYMNNNVPLPHETVRYVAMIAPEIAGAYPENRSEADQIALNTQPASQAPGLLPPGFAPAPIPNAPSSPQNEDQVAALAPEPPAESSVYTPSPALSAPAPTPPPEHHENFGLIASAMADTPAQHYQPVAYHGTGWAIQVGAYNTRENAKAALGIAELSAVQMLMHGEPVVVSTHSESGTKYRARVVGLPHELAVDACQRLSSGPTGCVILSPDGQS
jgi:cell division protein FtsN